MKFAKELDEDLVPEWRAKYFNYKQGKKLVKAITRARRNLNTTPRTPGKRIQTNLSQLYSEANNRTPSIFRSYAISSGRQAPGNAEEALRNAAPMGQSPDRIDRQRSRSIYPSSTPPVPIPEQEPLHRRDQEANGDGARSYGSIVATPPEELPALDLPDPALNPNQLSPHRSRVHPNQSSEERSDAYHVGYTKTPQKPLSSIPRRLFKPTRAASTPGPDAGARPQFMRRLFSTPGMPSPDVSLRSFQEVHAKEEEFFRFLNSELEKVEEFYKMKEEQASERLQQLKDQLHEMKDRRLEEIQEHKIERDETGLGSFNGRLHAPRMPQAMENAMRLKPHFGKTSTAMTTMGSPSAPKATDAENRRDYTRKPPPDHVPHRVAKRKLKMAMQEFYRGLELLKSYALLNRTAFRKINKKYDKSVHQPSTGKFMSEKVNKAHFVRSELIESYINVVEDLYARYFERGSHKIAVGKLRVKTARPNAYTAVAFRNGILLAAGAVLGIEGIVHGAEHLVSPDPDVAMKTQYLLQIYAGYLLGLILMLIFVLDCRVWSRAKINYVFIFEFDTRHSLDWRQLAELPCFLTFLEGLFIWLNFRQSGPDTMFIWWPVVLIALTVILIFLPAPVLYWRSRKWWAYSNWRLLLAGLYPVEFRDFFLGDIYCSETYAMGNIELFFCLYAGYWGNPSHCNSSHSRLLGFFSTLPAIWRALQCLRRYYDSRNWWPHLMNCMKYMFNILFYMSLSLWRIHKVNELRILFIIFGTINSVYCIFWDIFMDWSLGNVNAEYPLLRDRLGYRQVWTYYVAMIMDPIIRFNWIFYAIYSQDVQHSAVLAFFVALSEVMRRGMWSIFRVENEHCTNVGKFRASRDLPLPYSLPSSSKVSLQPSSPEPQNQQGVTGEDSATTGADVESQTTTPAPSLRRRKSRTTPQLNAMTPTYRNLQRMGTLITQAHAQDYEKKRRPEGLTDSPEPRGLVDTASLNSSDEDEEEEDDGLSPVSSRPPTRPDTTIENVLDEADIVEARNMIDGGDGKDRRGSTSA